MQAAKVYDVSRGLDTPATDYSLKFKVINL